MAKRIIKMKYLLVLSVFFLLVSVPITARAQTTTDEGAGQNATSRAEEARKAVENRRAEVEQNISDRKEAAMARLDEAKLKICQNRERTITAIMSRMSDRGQKQLELFGTIAERVQNFYDDSGNTLANYDELVSNMNAKKAAAETVLQELESAAAEFNCEGDDPKGALETFHEKRRAKIQALMEYRQSVRDLIVGVKSVQGSEEGGQ